jgi:arylsulfatase A-like enzyme
VQDFPITAAVDLTRAANRRKMIMLRSISVACSLLAIAASVATGAKVQPPNIIVIMADDLGQREVSCYKDGHIKTPNIDSIAKNGIRFRRFYAGNPTCAPSRYAFFTGQHHNRMSKRPLAGRTTIAAELRGRGYRTAMIGKWHINAIGPKSTFTPTKRGFEFFQLDYYYGAWYPPYWGHDRDVTTWWRMVRDDAGIDGWFEATGELDPPVGYSTDLLTDDAIALLRRTPKQRPLFLWLAYNTPHYSHSVYRGRGDSPHTEKNTFWILPEGGTPQKGRHSGETITLRNTLEAKPADVAAFKDVKNRKRRFFNAMVKAMDDNIGRLLDELKRTGRAKNTIVIFTSDQGSDETLSSAGNNRPFRGAKHTQWEGGMRVPLVVQWPDRIKPGGVSDQLGGMIDMLPTFCRIAGCDTENLLVDGIDLSPAILDGKTIERDLFFYERHPAIVPHAVYYRGPWKYADGQLYRLDKDLSETTDLANQYPAKVRELKAAHDRVRQEIGQ